MTEAALMIIIDNGLVLGVSRKRDHSKFGLIGGKLEPGETHREAAIRETFEETGIVVKDCEFILSRPDGEGYCSHCFLATDWEGELQSSEEGVVKWCWKGELTDPNSAFPEFNRVAFEVLEAKHPDESSNPPYLNKFRLEEEIGWLYHYGDAATDRAYDEAIPWRRTEMARRINETDQFQDRLMSFKDRKTTEECLRVIYGLDDKKIKELIDNEIRRYKLGAFK